jgi:hypothetical protein
MQRPIGRPSADLLLTDSFNNPAVSRSCGPTIVLENRRRRRRCIKIGTFAVLLADRPLEEALDHVKEVGRKAVELGTEGYPGNAASDQPLE